MEVKEKKKRSIWLFSIFMFIAFVITFLGIHMVLSSVIGYNILNYPYGKDIIFEAILAILVLIILLFWKNGYVFTQKSENFFKSLRFGLFHIIIGSILIVFEISNFKSNLPGVFNVAIFTAFIGIYEEFLLRGWLLNEFLERYGDSKKNVWISILISAFIFGIIHFINIPGAGFANTLMQVINATCVGVILGFAYYKTKNIWAVIFIHAFWDFSIIIGNLSPVTEVIGNINNISILSTILFTILSLIQLSILIPHLKNIDENVKINKIVYISLLSVFLWIGFTICTESVTQSDNSDNKKYAIDNISIKEYSITADNYERYYLEENNVQLLFYKTDSMLILENTKNNYSVSFDFTNIVDYSLYKFNNYYILAYVDIDSNGNNVLKYNYINCNSVTNNKEYLDNILSSMKSHYISEYGNIITIYDKEKEEEYLAVNTDNYGIFVLIEEGKVGILNRDK